MFDDFNILGFLGEDRNIERSIFCFQGVVVLLLRAIFIRFFKRVYCSLFEILRGAIKLEFLLGIIIRITLAIFLF